MVVNPQERPYIANVIGQLQEIQPASSGQDVTHIWAHGVCGENGTVNTGSPEIF